MDGMNVKSLEERSEGDVASPSSTGTQVQKWSNSHIYFYNTYTKIFFFLCDILSK